MSYTLDHRAGPNAALAAGGAFNVDLVTDPGNVLVLDTQGVGPPGPKGDTGLPGTPGGAVGPAGGVLSGTYPNPGFAVDMATQAEVDGVIANYLPLTGGTVTGEVALRRTNPADVLLSTSLSPGVRVGLPTFNAERTWLQLLNTGQIWGGFRNGGVDFSTYLELSGGNLQIRNGSPTGSGNASLGLSAAQDAVTGAVHSFTRSRGTYAAPTSLNDADTLALISYVGYDGTTNVQIAQQVVSVPTIAAAGRTTAMTWSTMSNGSALATRLRIHGNVVIVGGGAPAALNANERFRVNTPTTPDVLAATHLVPSLATGKAEVIQGLAGQTANLTEWQSSTGGLLAAVKADGGIRLGADVDMSRLVADTLVIPDMVWVGTGGGSGITQGATGPDMVVMGAGHKDQFTLGNLYVAAQSTGAIGADQGGSIDLGGSYAANGNTTPFARIAGGKDSAVAGEFGGYLALWTRPQGGSMTERLRITSTGDVKVLGPSLAIGTNPATTGAVRLPNNNFVMFRKADLSAPDILGIGVDAANGIVIGNASFPATAITLTAPKLGFFATAPIVKPTGTPAAATDLATTTALVNSLRASLVALGLVG